MGKGTQIPWAHHSFNMAWGCQRVSPGCENCYAEKLAARYGWHHDEPDHDRPRLWGPPKTTPRRVFGPSHWSAPLAWHRDLWHRAPGERERVFSSSMADIFEDHPTIDAERAKLWPLIRMTPQFDWLLLTKRIQRVATDPARFLPADWGTGYPNVWLGTSVEDQRRADERLPALRSIDAVVRFVSFEPLIGAVDVWPTLAPDWWIVGGESGATRRPMDMAWVRSLNNQCGDFGGAWYFKQRSAFKPDQVDGVPADLAVREFPYPRAA